MATVPPTPPNALMPENSPKRSLTLAVSAGSSFFGSIISGYFLGSFLDPRLGTGIVLTIVGTILGFVLGNLMVFKILLEIKKEKG